LYKLLLCWRYLRTRYLALACIVSVMLGVATLIVVNSVMSGFSAKLRDRLHGLLSDIVITAHDPVIGFTDPEGKMRLIQSDPFLRERIVAMAPTMEIFAMLRFNLEGGPFMRTVHLIGIDADDRAALGGFAEYLLDPADREHPSFDVKGEALQRFEHRQQSLKAALRRFNHLPPPPLGLEELAEPPLLPGGEPAPEVKPDPDPPPETVVPPVGIILGYAIAHFRDRDAPPGAKAADIRILHPGDEVVVLTVGGVEKMKATDYRYVVTDYFKSEMSEYDSTYVFVPLKQLQDIRGMENRATSIQIRLKDYAEAEAVVKRLEALFAGAPVEVQTWEKKQGPLLAAVAIEKRILNFLLFLIIAVAGFGILAIFSMIVIEKTRDIGILKALGASNVGVLKIFLGYGLLLGLVGAVVGTGLGVALTIYINEIEKWLGQLTGHEIFDKSVYYFEKIPTQIQPASVLMINVGAILIAVVFSILPALRAAMLHPVRALRYE
jgi:lipoprotein-releasing system permease protein